MVPLLQRVTLEKPQSNQRALPHHSVPRQGSACPHSGIAPGARRHRPSMAGGGYLGIHAEVPPTQYLRSASGNGARDQIPKPKPKQSKAKQSKAKQSKAKQSNALQCNAKHQNFFDSTAHTHPESGRPVGRLALALALAFDFLAPSRGRVEVLRSGQPGRDAGLAAPGHGWPMAAGPRSRTGARACRA